jgi:hypothetical protein
MAITNADGSIILSTKVDTSGLKSGFATMKGQASSVTSTFSKLGLTISAVFAVKQIVAFSNEAGKLATQTEASVQRLVDIYGNSANVVGDFIDQNALALGMSKASASAFSAVYGNLFSVWADQATNAELTNQYLEMTAVVASKTGRTVEDVQERIRSGLLGNTEAIEDLGVFVNVKTIEMTDAFKRMADGKSWEQLDAYTQQQIRTMAILEQATDKYGNEVADTSSLARSQFKASYEDFQNTWGKVVNTILIPILKVATEILNIFTIGLQSLFGLTGGILGEQQNNEALEQQKKAIEQQKKIKDETEKTGEALKDYTADFDELNTIQKDNSKKSGATTNPIIDTITKKDAKNTKKIADSISKTLLSIMGVVAVALVAVGIILCATGNLKWGIGFIIAGAGLLGVTMATLKSNAISKEVKDALSNVLIIAGIVAIILGILLFCTTTYAVGYGLALIALGVTTIVTSIAFNKDSIKEKMKGVFGGVLAIVGIIAIVIGVLLCCGGFWTLGLGAIVVGATSIVSTAVVNWNAIKQALKSPLGKAIAIIGVVAVVLGVLLCIAGFWGLGLGLIALGGVAVATVVTVNWNTILDKLKTVWANIKTWWNTYVAKYFTKEWWGNLAKNAINGFLKWIVNGLNYLIDKLNSFSFNLPSVLGGGTVGFNVKRLEVPQLAKGAVIPANKPFLAMLGDQKSGTNIETPLDTMVEAFNIALSNNQNSFNGTIEIPISIDGREILRVVRNNENAVGTQTVFGGFANAY